MSNLSKEDFIFKSLIPKKLLTVIVLTKNIRFLSNLININKYQNFYIEDI